MLRIEYKIIENFEGEIDSISDEDICYNFLLGNVSILSSDAVIDMDWEWIPLLDFAYCLRRIERLINTNSKAKEYFEFTENAETLEFSKEAEQLRISASFSPVTIITTLKDFEIATKEFHLSIGRYVRESVLTKEPPKSLKKYLSIVV
jgi:hypothetical protein